MTITEYRQWLKHRNEKRLRWRTLRKKRIKYLRTKEIQNLTEAKKSEQKYFDFGDQFETFTAPACFSFVENTEETNKYFCNLVDFINNSNNFGKRIYIDILNVDILTIDALMYLLAVVNGANNIYSDKYFFCGNVPSNAKIKKMFYDSGFFNYVNYKGTENIATDNDTVKIASGTDYNVCTAKMMADFVSEKAHVSKLKCRFIYIMMIELMANTHKHAYNQKNTGVLPRWYCFASYNKSDTITFTFVDTGEGIPTTVTKNFAERIDILRIKGEDKYVISALNGDFRTATKKENRGKGLPKLRQYCTDGNIQDMRIITNRADVTVHPIGYDSKRNSTPLRGTLYYWHLNINSLGKED